MKPYSLLLLPQNSTTLSYAETEDNSILGFNKHSLLSFAEVTEEIQAITQQIQEVLAVHTPSASYAIRASKRDDPNTIKTLFPVFPEESLALTIKSTGKRPIEDFDEVIITSGVCLFSNSGLQMIPQQGTTPVSPLNPYAPLSTPITSIICDQKLSFFEIESIERLSSTIAYALKNPAITNKCTRIVLDIPKAEYMLYLMEPLLKGFVSPELFLNYCDLVEQRSQKVTAFFYACLKKKLGKNIPLTTTLVSSQETQTTTVTRTGTLDILIPKLRQVATNFKPEITYSKKQQERLVEILLDEVRNTLVANGDLPLPYDLQTNPRTIRTFGQLSSVGYSHNYLSLARPKETFQGYVNKKLVIAVESFAETTIYEASAQLLPKIAPTAQLIALYPLEQYMSTQHWEKCQYGTVPEEVSSTSYFQNISLTNQQFREFYQSAYPYVS